MSVYCRKGPKMKVLGKIWKNHRNSIMQEDPGSQKESRRGATRWPHTPGAAWPGPRLGMVWTPRAPPLPPIYSLRHENPKTISLRPRNVLQRRHHRRQYSGGQKVSVLALCRDGELPPEPSPSTPPPSPSPLLTPMMTRE